MSTTVILVAALWSLVALVLGLGLGQLFRWADGIDKHTRDGIYLGDGRK